MWEYRIYETITGNYVGPIDLATNSMGRQLNNGSSGTSSMLPPSELSKEQWRALTTRWANTLVKLHVDEPLKPVAAQMITGRKWVPAKRTLELRHADIWSFLGARTTFGTNGYSGDQPTENNLPLENYSLASMLPFLIWAGTEGPTGNYQLPVFWQGNRITDAFVHSLPHDGPHSRIYWDYEVHFLASAFEEIISAQGGPDVDFVPGIVDGKLRWDLTAGAINAGSSDWYPNADEPLLTEVTHDEDGLKQANVVHSIGKGAEQSMRVQSAQADAVGPALERAVNYKDIDDYGILQSHANANVALANQPREQWAVSMLASSGPGITAMAPGHTLRLNFADDEWEPDGWRASRMIGFTTDQTEKVTLQLQPTGGD